ncbi:hypothetical protein GOBAR_DD14969 [Gossypium barbadense]|nr:hypothetical protein GOBAR_DD14969 [Gossypium barbadense]
MKSRVVRQKGEILQNLAEFQFSCYSANDMQGKAENKAAMRRNLGLSSADDQRPVVGCITRLVPQKGVHLIKHTIYRTLEMGGQFELLGSCPVPHIQVCSKHQTTIHSSLTVAAVAPVSSPIAHVDSRILKAVAIENSKDVDAAAEIVLSEILPYALPI